MTIHATHNDENELKYIAIDGQHLKEIKILVNLFDEITDQMSTLEQEQYFTEDQLMFINHQTISAYFK